MEKFSVSLPTGETLWGRSFLVPGSLRNLILLPGMDEHSLRYKEFAEYLNRFGIDVYVLDAFAQGLNATKVEDQQKWEKDSFAKNVEAAHVLVERLKKETNKPLSLMGHSMGSFMVQSYLERYPGSVISAVECGSNGPALGKMKGAYILSCLLVNKRNWNKPSKVLQKAGLGAYSKAIKNRKTDFDWLSYNEENVKTYMADPYCGHVNTNGFWKEFLRGMKGLYEKKNLRKISPRERILIVSGRDDPVGEMGKGPIRLAAMYRDLGVKDVTIRVYEGMRHEIHNEKDRDKVYADIKDFLVAV
jgi:alpha-beta hydrolase superfamily lysophospholipase